VSSERRFLALVISVGLGALAGLTAPSLGRRNSQRRPGRRYRAAPVVV